MNMEILSGCSGAPAKTWRFVKYFGAAATVMFATAHGAHAGSVNANTGTYAGDVGGIELPAGTVVLSNYAAYRHGGKYYGSDGTASDGNMDVYTEVARVDWMAGKVLNMPLVLSLALNYASPLNIDIGGASMTGNSALFAPTMYFTLGLIVDPKRERDLAISNYIVLPLGDYDANKNVNVATPRQTVDIVQLTYQEGLGKFSPYLKNFWLDAFGAVTFHSDGENPTPYHATMTQDNSYDVSVYLRYNWNPLMFAAIGIEKAWGGEQIARDGPFDVSMGKDEYLKGHLQFAIPLSETFQIATDITHDFERTGSFTEDFTAEVRLVKMFMGAGSLEKAPLK